MTNKETKNGHWIAIVAAVAAVVAALPVIINLLAPPKFNPKLESVFLSPNLISATVVNTGEITGNVPRSLTCNTKFNTDRDRFNFQIHAQKTRASLSQGQSITLEWSLQEGQSLEVYRHGVQSEWIPGSLASDPSYRPGATLGDQMVAWYIRNSASDDKSILTGINLQNPIGIQYLYLSSLGVPASLTTNVKINFYCGIVDRPRPANKTWKEEPSFKRPQNIGFEVIAQLLANGNWVLENPQP